MHREPLDSEGRALRLPLATTVGLGRLVPGKEIFKPREHVILVDCRVDDAPPIRNHTRWYVDGSEWVRRWHVTSQCIVGIKYLSIIFYLIVSFTRPYIRAGHNFSATR